MNNLVAADVVFIYDYGRLSGAVIDKVLCIGGTQGKSGFAFMQITAGILTCRSDRGSAFGIFKFVCVTEYERLVFDY